MAIRIQPLYRPQMAHHTRPKFVDTARQAIEAEMASKANSAQEAARGLQDAQALLRIGEGGIDTQTQIASRIRELAIQGNNAGIPQEARDAIAGELGALQAEFARVGAVTSFGTNTVADGGSLSVVADSSGTRIDQTLPNLGPTASSLAGVESMPPAAAISFASSALSATLSARAQLGAYDNQYSTATSNLLQSMEHHTQALARLNAMNSERQEQSPLERLREELRNRLRQKQTH